MNYQDDLREKTLAYINEEGVTRTHICKKISMTPGAFTMWLKGERQLGEDKERALKEFLADKAKQNIKIKEINKW